jgi:hypothetical protein
MPPEFHETALSTTHTVHQRSRFSPGVAAETPFEVMYLAESPTATLYEVRAQFGPPERPVANSQKGQSLIIGVDVRLYSVADLTDPKQQRLLGTSAQELTGDWEHSYPDNDAPTQRLGAAMFAVDGIEGFFAISAQMPRCKTLIVFPQKLREGSEVQWKNPITGKTERMGPTGSRG